VELEQAIHQRWAASPALEALLPAAKLTTGLARGETLPYATLARTGGRVTLRTNSGDTVEEVSLRFHVWHGDYDAGSAIVGQVLAAFESSDFALASGARVVQMRRTTLAATQQDDGDWQFAIEFLAQIRLSSAL
jgi:hypothetical protein